MVGNHSKSSLVPRIKRNRGTRLGYRTVHGLLIPSCHIQQFHLGSQTILEPCVHALLAHPLHREVPHLNPCPSGLIEYRPSEISVLALVLALAIGFVARAIFVRGALGLQKFAYRAVNNTECMQSVLIIKCFIWNLSFLCSALYANSLLFRIMSCFMYKVAGNIDSQANPSLLI